MEAPKIGDLVKLYPAPFPRQPDDDGPVIPRRVSDGPAAAGFAPRFLPASGAERHYDYFWHDRLMAGDVCLTDPKNYQHGTPEGHKPPAPKLTPSKAGG